MKLSHQAQLVAQCIYIKTRRRNLQGQLPGWARELTYEECAHRHIFFQAPYVRDLVQAKIIGESGTGVYIRNEYANTTPGEFINFIKNHVYVS